MTDRVLDIHKCARCTEDHEGLIFKHFTIPVVDDDGTEWVRWATCPVTGDPILSRDLVPKDRKDYNNDESA